MITRNANYHATTWEGQLEEISNDPAAARPLKSPGDHAVILARRLDSLTSLELTPMAKAYMQDAAGMLRGIASGTISNGQSRLAQSTHQRL